MRSSHSTLRMQMMLNAIAGLSGTPAVFHISPIQLLSLVGSRTKQRSKQLSGFSCWKNPVGNREKQRYQRQVAKGMVPAQFPEYLRRIEAGQ